MFDKMIQVLPECEKGIAKIRHFHIDSYMSMMAGETLPEGDYAVLTLDGEVMMTDAFVERRTNTRIVYKAHGDVLIAGLGIGMIAIPILKKKEVSSVTIVEKNKDVCDLILPCLEKRVGKKFDKLEVVCSDIYDFDASNKKWNTIYFDIWARYGVEQFRESEKLCKKYKSNLIKDGNEYISSWIYHVVNRDKECLTEIKKYCIITETELKGRL